MPHRLRANILDDARHRVASNWAASLQPIDGLEIPTVEQLRDHRGVMPNSFPNRVHMVRWLCDTFDLSLQQAQGAATLCWPSYSRFSESVYPSGQPK